MQVDGHTGRRQAAALFSPFVRQEFYRNHLFPSTTFFCNQSCSESCSFGWTYNHPFFFSFKKTDQNALLKDQHIRQASVWASSLPWKNLKNKFDNQCWQSGYEGVGEWADARIIGRLIEIKSEPGGSQSAPGCRPEMCKFVGYAKVFPGNLKHQYIAGLYIGGQIQKTQYIWHHFLRDVYWYTGINLQAMLSQISWGLKFDSE